MNTLANWNQSSDTFAGVDKVQHFLACLAFAFLSSLLLANNPCQHFQLSIPRSALAGVLASFAVGILKEVGDSAQTWPTCPCQPSWKDLVADFCGTFVGTCFFLIFPTEFTCVTKKKVEGREEKEACYFAAKTKDVL